MSLQTTLNKLKENMIQRQYKKVYIAVDLHGTVLNSTYSKDILPDEFHPDAKEVLQYLSLRNDIILIMYTCSHLEEIEKYQLFFKEHGINFKYVNENPEVQSTPGIGNFSKKPYFQLLLEDKAGFDPNEDWEIINKFFHENPYFCVKSKTGYSCPVCNTHSDDYNILYQTQHIFDINTLCCNWIEYHKCKNIACSTIYYLHNGT